MVKWDSELWFPVDFHTVLIAKILLHFGFWSYPGLTVGDWYWPSVIEGDSIFCLCAASHTSCFISPLVDLKPAIFSSLSPSVHFINIFQLLLLSWPKKKKKKPKTEWSHIPQHWNISLLLTILPLWILSFFLQNNCWKNSFYKLFLHSYNFYTLQI